MPDTDFVSLTAAVASPIAAAGVWTAILTPLTAALEPDLPALAAHTRWLIDAGCDGLALLGSTGEANSLSPRQRRAVVEGVIEAGIPGEKIIVGTGASALDDAVAYTRYAVDVGAAGQLVLPPFFYKDLTEDGLFRFYASLIERVGDSRMRIYLYHLPQTTAVPITYTLIYRLLRAFPGVIAGIKDSSGDWRYTERLLARIPKLAVYCGAESYLMRNLRAGGAGCISGTTNFTAALASRLRDAVRFDDREGHAETIQAKLDLLRDILEVRNPIATLKAMKAESTGLSDWLHMLPPNEPISPKAMVDTVALIDAILPRCADGRGWVL